MLRSYLRYGWQYKNIINSKNGRVRMYIIIKYYIINTCIHLSFDLFMEGFVAAHVAVCDEVSGFSNIPAMAKIDRPTNLSCKCE